MKKETKYLIALAALIGVVLFFVFKQKQEADKKSDTDKKEPKENKGNDAKGNDANAGDDGETGTHKSAGIVMIDPSQRKKISGCFVEKGGISTTMPFIFSYLHKAMNNPANSSVHPRQWQLIVDDLEKVICTPCNTNEVAEQYNYVATAGKQIDPIKPAISIGEVKALQYEQLESNGKEVRML